MDVRLLVDVVSQRDQLPNDVQLSVAGCVPKCFILPIPVLSKANLTSEFVIISLANCPFVVLIIRRRSSSASNLQS